MDAARRGVRSPSTALGGLLGMLLLLGGGGCASPSVAIKPKAVEEAERLSRQAAQLQAQGDMVGASVWWSRATQQYQLLNDRTNLAMAWHNLGMVRRSQGRLAEAAAEFERAARLNAELGRTDVWWRNQLGLLQTANDAGDPGVEALLIRLDNAPDRPDDGPLVAVWMLERARAWMALGRLPEALAEAERAEAAFVGRGDRLGESAACVIRAKILRRMGENGRAVGVWERALWGFERLGDLRGIAVAMAGLGGSLGAEGRERERALGLLRRAEENYRRLGLNSEADAVLAEWKSLGASEAVH